MTIGPSAKFGLGLVAAIFALLAGLAFLLDKTVTPADRQRAEEAQRLSRGSYPVDQWASVWLTFLGCTTIPRTDEIKKIMQSGDQEAWKRAAAVAMATGECDLFNEGDSVYTVENRDYMTKVRKRGATRAYWLNPAVLK